MSERLFLSPVFRFVSRFNNQRYVISALTTRDKRRVCLDFCDGYRFRIADFNTTFTSQALLRINRHGFAIFHLKNVHGTDLDALLARFTFIRINGYFISHFFVLLAF